MAPAAIAEKTDWDRCLEVAREVVLTVAPPPDLKVSEWADEHAYLSPESSAEPGQWSTIPYQRAILDAFSDPEVEEITVYKSARIGWTKIINNVIGYFMHQDPCSILVVQPTIEDAEGYSKDEIGPMLRDTEALQGLVSEQKTRDSSNTIKKKSYPGGTLHIIGANSPRGFRRITVRIVLFDETDGYPPTAGKEGDQLKLGKNRANTFWNRKIAAGSTPTEKGSSRIEERYEQSDKRRYKVPCPHCNTMQVLVFKNLDCDEDADGNKDPSTAYFKCTSCEERIEHHHKEWMVENGEWVAEKEFNGHAGFHIWAAYSYSPKATWSHILQEFFDCKDNPEALRTFINTWLGETWEDQGEAPEWESLYKRAEHSGYKSGEVPRSVLFLTAGVDVQKDRIEATIVGWGRDRKTWHIDHRIFPGDTSSTRAPPWRELSNLVHEHFQHEAGFEMPLLGIAIDTGYRPHICYSWARKFARSGRVFACKSSSRRLQGFLQGPKAVDVNQDGKKLRRGVRLWEVDSIRIKDEIYDDLDLEKQRDEESPPGWCEFANDFEQEFYRQLTAENKVKVRRNGILVARYDKIYERNEVLDCRMLARVAAHIKGMDRWSEDRWDTIESEVLAVEAPKRPAERKGVGPGTARQASSPRRRRRSRSVIKK